MMFSDLPKNAVAWKASDPYPTNERYDIGRGKSSSKKEKSQPQESLLRAILGSCGGFMETATFFLRPSDCASTCARRRPMRSSMKRQGSTKKFGSSSQPNSPSRAGEVVDVPIKLVKSSGSKGDDAEPVYEPDQSFDDSISAISAHTLEEMAQLYPKPIMAALRENDGTSKPRNGDQLMPPSAARISSDSSDDSEDRNGLLRHNGIENDIPFEKKKLTPMKISRMDSPTDESDLPENDIPFVRKPRLRTSLERTYDADKTPKASGRKSKRRAKRIKDFEPQVAEI